MKNLYHRLLLLIAGSTQKELASQIRYLKIENEILRSKLPTRHDEVSLIGFDLANFDRVELPVLFDGSGQFLDFRCVFRLASFADPIGVNLVPCNRQDDCRAVLPSQDHWIGGLLMRCLLAICTWVSFNSPSCSLRSRGFETASNQKISESATFAS